MYSLTKYAGGHSDLVAGGVLGTNALITTIRLMRNTIGTILDPHSAWMLMRSLETERRAREEQDDLLRSTIKALNLHWLKRFLWGGGALLLLQLVAYAFLASKIDGL